MSRKTHKELERLMKQEDVSRLWSWSKWDTFFNSPYEYYLKYIKKIPEDRTDCIYVVTGSIAHDILEKLYCGKLKYEDMISNFEDGWLSAYEISSMKFDRNDEEKDRKIANKYYLDLRHFFQNHQVLPYKPMIEEFAKVKVGNNLFQGYIDVCFKDDEGNYHIVDWKTSSQYKGKTITEKCGQLVIYAMALMQQGIPMDKIKICWNFLKYVNVTTELKNGTVKERTIERFEIGDKLKSNAKTWLKSFGYSNEEIEDYLEKLVFTNDIEVLPEEVQNKYKFSDCYSYIPLTQELIDTWSDLIIKTIDQIEYCEKEYADSQSDKVWWDTDENVEKQSYYFATLCGYSANLHLPYKQYLERLEATKDGGDMFNNIGTNTDEMNVGQTVDEDLSWLDEI